MFIGFKNTLAEFYNDDAGATAIEYGLIAALVAVSIIAAITTFSTNMIEMYVHISSTTDGVVNGVP